MINMIKSARLQVRSKSHDQILNSHVSLRRFARQKIAIINNKLMQYFRFIPILHLTSKNQFHNVTAPVIVIIFMSSPLRFSLSILFFLSSTEAAVLSYDFSSPLDCLFRSRSSPLEQLTSILIVQFRLLDNLI